MRNDSSSKIISYTLKHREIILYISLFIVNLLLVSPQLMPDYSMVNPDDEAKYVDSGWRLLKGDIREIAWGPVVALVYAPIHLAIGASPDWFMLEVWIGRFILYTFLWWSIFYLGYQLKNFLSPYVLIAILFVSTPLLKVLVNQSDAVFIGFSSLALAHLIKYYREGKIKYLGIASLFVGLCVLTRVETIVLLVTTVAFGIVIGKGKQKLTNILIASMVPAIAILGFYFVVSLIFTGEMNLSVAYKSYDSFEMNQSILTGGDIDLARQQSDRLFGTQEENQGSILRAILHNPPAFALRIWANAKTIPLNFLDFLGKKIGPVLILFAIYGIYSLIRNKAWLLLAILLIWPLHALIALGFLSLHIVPQTIYVLLILAAIGITELFSFHAHQVEKLVFLAFTVILFILSLATGKPAFLVSFLLLTVVLVVYVMTSRENTPQLQALHFAVFLLLTVGIILREPYQFPNYPVFGQSAAESAIRYLELRLPAQTNVIVPTPLPAIASRMLYITMDDIPESIIDIKDLWTFLKEENVQAVYLDSNRRVRSELYDLFESGFNQYFTLAYTSPDKAIRIFNLN